MLSSQLWRPPPRKEGKDCISRHSDYNAKIMLIKLLVVTSKPYKYFLVQFDDLEENPMPRLRAVMRRNLLELDQFRYRLRRDGSCMACVGLLVFKKPCRVRYCDLAIIEDGKHMVEPWLIHSSEDFGPGSNLYNDFYEDDEEIQVVKF